MAKCIIFHYHGGSFVGIIRVPIGEFLSLKALGVWERNTPIAQTSFMQWGFRPCGEQIHASVNYKCWRIWIDRHKADVFVNIPPMSPTHNLFRHTSAYSDLILPFAGGRTKHNTKTFIHPHEQTVRCQGQDHLYIQPCETGKPVCGLWNDRPPLLDGACEMQPAGIWKKRHRGNVHWGEGIYHCPARIIP